MNEFDQAHRIIVTQVCVATVALLVAWDSAAPWTPWLALALTVDAALRALYGATMPRSLLGVHARVALLFMSAPVLQRRQANTTDNNGDVAVASGAKRIAAGFVAVLCTVATVALFVTTHKNDSDAVPPLLRVSGMTCAGIVALWSCFEGFCESFSSDLSTSFVPTEEKTKKLQTSSLMGLFICYKHKKKGTKQISQSN
eukprot:PhM_4_TR11682/c0_g2_i5/m.76227